MTCEFLQMLLMKHENISREGGQGMNLPVLKFLQAMCPLFLQTCLACRVAKKCAVAKTCKLSH